MNAEEVVRAFAIERPQAVALAEVVSFAVLIDRALLRKARTQLVPDADAGAEADLWLSPLIKSRSRDGLTFPPDIAMVLRRRLSPQRASDAWALTRASHEHLPPTLQLEETVNYLSIDDSEEAAHKIDELLSSVLAAMAAGGRDGLASWAARAFENFPTSVRRRDAAQMIAAGANLRLGIDPRATLGDAELPDWLRTIAPAHLPTDTVGVQLAPRLLRVDATPEPAGSLLRLPATRPLLLDVSWTGADGAPIGRQLALRPGDTQHLEVGADEVQLRTVSGEVYELRLGGTAPVEVRPHIIDFSDLLSRADPRSAIDLTPAPVTLIHGAPGSGKTMALAHIVRRLQSQGTFCAYHFFEIGIPKLEYFDVAERSLIAQFLTKYDIPAWAMTLRLHEFLRTFAGAIGSGPACIVLDNIDQVQGYSAEDVLGPLMELPGQYRVIASSRKASSLRVQRLELKAQSSRSSVPETLTVLAVARAPLPLDDAQRLSLPRTPWNVTGRSPIGERSVAFVNESSRIQLLAQHADRLSPAHHQLAVAISGDIAPEERTWYGVRYGAWHWEQAGLEHVMTSRELRRAVELFGARVAADMLDELARYKELARALRAVAQRVDESPADLVPILQSSIAADDMLLVEPNELQLRILSHQPGDGARVRVRPPQRIVAMHAHRGESLANVMRCPSALMFFMGDQHIATVRTSRLTASALSPRGDELMTGDADGSVTFWSTLAGSQGVRHAAHRAEVTHVLLSYDSAYSIAADGTIARWTRSGQTWSHTTFAGPTGIITAIAAEDYLAVGCANGNINQFVAGVTIVDEKAHNGPVTGLALLDHDTVLVSVGADRTIQTRVRGANERETSIDSGHTHAISSLASAAPFKNTFVTSAADGAVRLWSLERTEVTPVNIFTEHTSAVTALYMDPDFIISGSADGEIVVRTLAGETFTRRHAHDGPVRAVVMLASSQLLTGGDDAELQRWRVSHSDMEHVPHVGVTGIASSRERIFWCSGGKLRLGETETPVADAELFAIREDGVGSITARERTVQEYPGRGSGATMEAEAPVVAVLYANHGRAYAALENGTVIDLGTRRRVTHTESRLTCAVGGAFVLTGHANGEVWGELSRVDTYTSPVTALALSDDGYMASGAADGSLHVDGFSLSLRGKHAGRVRHLAFVPNYLIASTGDDLLMMLWNFQTNQRVATCAGHRDRITALIVDPRASLIYTASLDTTVRAWDFQGNQRGIVYGNVPFSALALGDEGTIIAGDDAGALWTLQFGAEPVRPEVKKKAAAAPRKKAAPKKKAMQKKK